jgi:hypothetical protein
MIPAKSAWRDATSAKPKLVRTCEPEKAVLAVAILHFLKLFCPMPPDIARFVNY